MNRLCMVQHMLINDAEQFDVLRKLKD